MKRPHRTFYRQDYQPPPWLVDHVNLDFDLSEEFVTVRARTSLRRNQAATDTPQPLILNGQGPKLEEIRLDGQPLTSADFDLGADYLTIHQPPQSFDLEIVCTLRPQDNTSYEGLHRSQGMLCTQCEAEGFRKITWFPDRPDVMAPYHVRITAEKSAWPVLLSNGNPTASGDIDTYRHWVEWDDPHPKPSYLFALVAGDLVAVRDRFRTRSGRDIALAIWVERGDEGRCNHAMTSLKAAMEWDEQVFGREYDLDVFNIVAVSHTNIGAMENKGLNIFNSKYILADEHTGTDQDFLSIEGIVAHEYFHNWTGNRVTCRDWFQLSLKEGLTVFREQLFLSDMNSAAVKRIQDVHKLRLGQFPEDSGPMAHPIRPNSYIDINNFYTMTVYEKGAEVIRMLYVILGANHFRRGMDLYFDRHDGRAVTCDDFVQSMEDASAVSLDQFRRWYEQSGTPEITVESRWEAGTLELRLCQSTPASANQPDKKPLVIPIAVGLIGPDGRDRPVTLEGESTDGPLTRILVLDTAAKSFRLTGLDAPPVPSVLRGFSAPVHLREMVDDETLTFRLAHDSDSFNRWDAGQRLGLRLILNGVKAVTVGKEVEVPEAFVQAIHGVLNDADSDPAFAALALSLPDEILAGQAMAHQGLAIDVDSIHQTRRTILSYLGHRLADRWWTLCPPPRQEEEAFSLSPEAIGRRALANVALSFLMAVDGIDDQVALASTRLKHCRAMSDILAAFHLLCHRSGPERAEAIGHFYTRFREQPLVIDKWFTAQALAIGPNSVEAVAELTRHPDFSLKAPNRVRALIGAFASTNPTGFHRVDGAGYRLVANHVLALDPLNPQLAARLMGAFTRWRQYSQERQHLMQAEIDRILSQDRLSADVYEIASRSWTAEA